MPQGPHPPDAFEPHGHLDPAGGTATSYRNPGTREALNELTRLPRDPSVRPWVLALASLVVPGLGQVCLGQRLKGAVLFGVSAGMCFGGGLCNAVAALDAWTLARARQQRDIDSWELSIWLVLARLALRLARALTRALRRWLASLLQMPQ